MDTSKSPKAGMIAQIIEMMKVLDDVLSIDDLEVLGELPEPWPREALKIAIKRLRRAENEQYERREY